MVRPFYIYYFVLKRLIIILSVAAIYNQIIFWMFYFKKS